MAVLKGKVERDKAPYTVKCETALTLCSVIPPATQAQKSAKLIWVCRVKYQGNPVKTEKFKMVFSAQGPVKPQQFSACSGHHRRVGRMPWSKCHPSHLLQDPTLNVGYAQDCIWRYIDTDMYICVYNCKHITHWIHSVSVCICLEMSRVQQKTRSVLPKLCIFLFCYLCHL